MWSSRRHCACHLLLLEQQLVVLVDMRSTMPRSPSRFGVLHGRLAAASPFSSSAYSHAGCVHAFEVPVASIRGLDYSNPLVLEARLVLETVGLRKREFPTVRLLCALPALPSALLPLRHADQVCVWPVHLGCSAVQLEVARAYYLERPARACSSTSAAQRQSSSVQLGAALHGHPPRRSSGDGTTTSEGGEGPGMDAGQRSSARSNLALRLAGACSAGQPAEAQARAAPRGGTPPVPIEKHGNRTTVRFSSAVTELEVAAADATPPGGGGLDDDDSFESEFGSQWYWGSPTRDTPPPAVVAGAVESAVAAAHGSSAASSATSTLARRAELAASAPASPGATADGWRLLLPDRFGLLTPGC
jgi:hypothetical protein